MDRDTVFSAWAGRMCLGVMVGLGGLGVYYGNVRFLPIAIGFAILARVCYASIPSIR